jgi:hypothetical protein
MRTPAAVAAWAEWVVWTCNTGNLLVTVKRERASARSFFLAAHAPADENRFLELGQRLIRILRSERPI